MNCILYCNRSWGECTCFLIALITLTHTLPQLLLLLLFKQFWISALLESSIVDYSCHIRACATRVLCWLYTHGIRSFEWGKSNAAACVAYRTHTHTRVVCLSIQLLKLMASHYAKAKTSHSGFEIYALIHKRTHTHILWSYGWSEWQYLYSGGHPMKRVLIWL